MENIGYEEFPKLANEEVDSSSADGRVGGGGGGGEGGGEGAESVIASDGYASSSNPPPPVYTTAASIGYPQEPPPAYSRYHLPCESSFPAYYPFTEESANNVGHDYFGVLIDRTSGPPPPVVVTDPPADYLASSIFNLIFCCFVFGLLALMKSLDARGLNASGNYEQAYVFSVEARNWNIAAAITGGILWTMAILSIIVMYTV